MSDSSAQRRIGYTEKVIDHFTHPRNAGKIKDPDITAKVGSVACGDLIKLYLKVDPQTAKINDIKFESYGCAANIATSSMMTEMVKGKVLEEVKGITFENIASELGGLPKIKMHCAVLSKTAIDAALLKYEAKKGMVKIDETLVRRILRGVLDPIEGTDIVSAGMINTIEVIGRTVALKLSVAKGSEMAKVLEEDIRESFEGIDISLSLIFKESS